MSTFKKILTVFLIALLTTAIAACSGSGDGANVDKDGYTHLTVFDSDANADWENMESPIGQKIKEDTKVILEPEFDFNGGEQKIALMVASGEYPDMIISKGAGNLVDAGALIDLEPLIEEHAPNIKKMLGDQLKRNRWSLEDPSIYVLSTAPLEGEYLKPGYGAILQHDVVRELGYPEIKTVKDLENAIREYKELHPTIDGQKTIGLTLNSDGWRMQAGTLNGAFFATGASDDGEYYIDPETYEAKLHYRRPEEKEYFRWLNHMNAEGLLDPESFVQKDDQYMSKLSTGRALASFAPEYMDDAAQNTLRAAGMDERMYGMYPVVLDETYKHAALQDYGFRAGWGISITVDCEDPVAAIKFLDYLVSEETQIMLNWGLEGEHHIIDENGNRVIPEDMMEARLTNPDFAKETGIGYNFQRLAPRYGDGTFDSTGQPFTINTRELVAQNYTDVEKEVLAAYGAEIWTDLYPSSDELPVKPWGAAYNISIPAGSDLEVINQRLLDITLQRVPEAILTSPENFDKVWDGFMEELIKAGVEQAEEEYSKLIQDTVKLWTSDDL